MARSDYSKVPKVDGGDLSGTEALSHSNNRRIGGAERQIAVLARQLAHPSVVLGG